MKHFVTNHEFTRRLTSRFVAGGELQDALEVILQLNEQGFEASLNYLGESVTSEEAAELSAEEYLKALDEIYVRHVRSHISVKLTQLGISLSENLCYKLMKRILVRAQSHNNFIRIDMEDSAYTDKTIAIYRKLRRKYSNIGVAIQSYLYRSEDDVKKMLEKGAKIRLVKGAYLEPKNIVYSSKNEVDKNYLKLMKMLLNKTVTYKSTRIAIATHDEKIIQYALEYAEEHNLTKKEYEFQMMYGIRGDIQKNLMQRGFTTRIYVPYGKSWYPYFMRRLAERPANLIFFLRNLVRI